MDSYRNGDLRFDVLDSGGGPGEGEAVVLLHGFPQSSASWAAVTPRLVAAGYRVLAPDQRGYSPGAQPKGRRNYTVDLLAGDVVALLDAAGIQKAHVVGHDWGGTVAWALATLHPDRLISVTSLSTPHSAAMLRSWVTSSQLLKSYYMLLFQLPGLPERALALDTEVGRQRFTATMVKSGLSREHAAATVERIAEPGALTGGLNWYRALPLGRPGSVRRPVQLPTLYVWGTGDQFLGRAAAELTRRWVTGPYRFEALDGASHWLPEENAGQISDLVLEHLAANKA